MPDAIVQERLRRMGLCHPLQPFGAPGTPLCDVFRWSDFLGLDQRRNVCGTYGVREVLHAMGLTRLPQLGKESRYGLVGLFAVVQVPPLEQLVPHMLWNLECAITTGAAQSEEVVAVLIRLAGRHPEIRSALLASVRRLMEQEGRIIRWAMLERFCEVLRRWGDPSDEDLLVRLLHEDAPEKRIAGLWTAYSLGLCTDAGFRHRLESLAPEACDEGVTVAWGDLLKGLEGGDLDAWFLLLGHSQWDVRQTVAQVLAEIASSHPDPESVFEILRERLLVEDDSDVMMCLGWALGVCLRRLGVDAAEILIQAVSTLPNGLETRAGLAVLRALVRLPSDPRIWPRLEAALGAMPQKEEEVRRNLAVVRRHFDPHDVSPETIACRLREEGGWVADLADPNLEPHGLLARVLEQQADCSSGLWIAIGSKTEVAPWVRGWEAARISHHHPELSQAFAAAAIPTAHGRRRQFAAVGCVVAAVPVGVDPLYLACALDLPPETSMPDTSETATILMSLLEDSGLAENARNRLNSSGPVVRALWNRRLEVDQMNTYSNDRTIEARNQLFFSGAESPEPIALAQPGWLQEVGFGTGQRALECLGAIPGPDPVGRSSVLGILEEAETIRRASVLWSGTLDGALAAWEVLLGRGDWEGREGACRLAMGVPAAFWQGEDGEQRLQQLMAFRLDSDSDVNGAAKEACELLGVEPLPEAPEDLPVRRRRHRR